MSVISGQTEVPMCDVQYIKYHAPNLTCKQKILCSAFENFNEMLAIGQMELEFYVTITKHMAIYLKGSTNETQIFVKNRLPLTTRERWCNNNLQTNKGHIVDTGLSYLSFMVLENKYTYPQII